MNAWLSARRCGVRKGPYAPVPTPAASRTRPGGSATPPPAVANRCHLNWSPWWTATEPGSRAAKPAQRTLDHGGGERTRRAPTMDEGHGEAGAVTAYPAGNDGHPSDSRARPPGKPDGGKPGPSGRPQPRRSPARSGSNGGSPGCGAGRVTRPTARRRRGSTRRWHSAAPGRPGGSRPARRGRTRPASCRGPCSDSVVIRMRLSIECSCELPQQVAMRTWNPRWAWNQTRGLERLGGDVHLHQQPAQFRRRVPRSGLCGPGAGRRGRR